MKHYVLFILLSFMPMAVMAQLDMMPDSPLDTSMGDAASDKTKTVNQQYTDEELQAQEEKERQEDILENRYDVPDDQEEDEFNKNGI